MKRWTRKAIDLREKFSQRAMMMSLIVFAVSLLIFNASNNAVWIAFAGFIMVMFGAIIVLFVLTFLIFWFLERMLYRKKIKMNEIPSKSKGKVSKRKKPVKKKVSKKKSVNKPVKKKVSKKKIVRKSVKKKVSKKKPSKKKRK